MTNVLYDTGRQGFLDGSFNWASASVKAMFVGSGYSPNASSDEFVTDIPSGQIIARSAALGGKTEAAGVAAANNVTLGSVSGPDIHFIVIYEDTGSDATSRLIALIDTATGMPTTPSGGDITIAWDTGPNKVFKL